MAFAASVLLPGPAQALEATIFVSGASPSNLWGSGAGGALSIGLFDIGAVEIEGARQSLDEGTTGMASFSGRAMLAPTFGRIVPYAGLSTGVRREKTASASDWGTVSGVFVGAKLKLPIGLRLRAEYQWIHLPDDALVPMDKRYSAGLGLAF
jgi:hypothetical protein